MKDVTDTVYMAEIQRLNERIAELEKDRDAEAENCRLMQDRLQRMIDGNMALKQRIAELEAENDVLRCCGNCDSRGAIGDDDFCMMSERNYDKYLTEYLSECWHEWDRRRRIYEISRLDKRIAELEAKTEWYHEEHAKELNARVRLEATVERLKCCGNCKAFHHCQFRLSDVDVIVKPPENFDCNKWEAK